MTSSVASYLGRWPDEVEDHFTLRQIILLFYLQHRDEVRKMVLQTKMLAELLLAASK